MPTLLLRVIGPPLLEMEGRTVRLERRKSLALLVFLAVTGEGHARDTLSTLFWPDQGQSQARASLRRALADLTTALGGGLTTGGREAVGLAPGRGPWLDLKDFRRLASGCAAHAGSLQPSCPECLKALGDAVSLYRNDFLSGFTLPDCRAFDEWEFFQTEQIRDELAEALRHLTLALSAEGRAGEAVSYARRWVALDPVEEEAHRALIGAYAASGQHAAALRQYRECARILQEELETEPEAETRELLAEVRKRPRSAERATAPRAERPEGLVQGPPAAAQAESLRYVAVLAAGMSGDADGAWAAEPESMAEKVAAFRERARVILAELGAVVDESFADDRVAVFGAPVSHEDDAERAVRAALAVREEARSRGLSLGCGLAVGMACVSGSSVMGAVVNNAARLRYRAEQDQILASPAAQRRTRGAAAFEPVRLAVTGAGREETAYRLTRLLPEPLKPYGIEGLRCDLVGRGAELEKMERALDLAVRGSGQLVTLIGDAGIGKSRLVRELRADSGKASGGAGIIWLDCGCRELGSGTSYWPFLEGLRGWLGFRQGDEETDKAAEVAARLERLAREGALPADSLAETGAILGSLFSIRFGTTWDGWLGALDPAEVRRETFLTLDRLIGAMTAEAPMVIALEDLHWADGLSLDLISRLIDSLRERPLLVLCTYRPERDHRCSGIGATAARRCPERYTEIALGPLAPAESSKMLGSLLGIAEVPGELKELVLRRAHGNPFYLEEILRSLIDSGVVARGEQGWEVRIRPEQAPVSENILAITQSRVDRLDGRARQVLQTASALGDVFSLGVLERATGADVLAQLRGLAAASLVYEEQGFPDPQYGFTHVLVREAVYQTIPQETRRELHGRIGEALESLFPEGREERAEELAHHFEQAAAGEKAAEYLLLAGSKAAQQDLNQAAVAFFLRAAGSLGALPEGPGRDELELQAHSVLGETFWRMARDGEAEEHTRKALALAGRMGLPPERVISISHQLALILVELDRPSEAVSIAEEALALLADAPESPLAVKMKVLRAWCFQRSDHAMYTRFALECAPLLETQPYAGWVAAGYMAVAEASAFLGRGPEADRWFDLALRQVRAHNDRGAERALRQRRAVIALFRGDLEFVIDEMNRNGPASEKAGDYSGVAWASAFGGWASEWLGDLERSLALSRKAEEVARAHEEEWPWFQLFRADALRNGATALLGLGRRDEGFDSLGQAIALYRSIDTTGWLPSHVLTNLIYNARTLLAVGRENEAKTLLLNLIERVTDTPESDKVSLMPRLPIALAGLEEAMDDPEAFRAFCRDYKARHPGADRIRLVNWHFEPADPALIGREEEMQWEDEPAASGWEWVDSKGRSSFEVAGGALSIKAANGDNLWFLNTRAPRLLRPVSGDFAAQVECQAALPDRPALGGLAVWKDTNNFLVLERGGFGQAEVSFRGRVGGEDRVAGRGRLASAAVWLRLERRGNILRALCSPDGTSWWGLGDMETALGPEVQAGVYASGWIDRSFHIGVFPEGSAVRFRAFRLGHMGSQPADCEPGGVAAVTA